MYNNEKLPLVSVIIPVYNVAEYLEECIDSIIIQTYQNLEIILVDDGSTDNSGEICDDYKNNDERIIVIHQRNGGLSAARNAGVKIASGNYVTFVDSDDYITSDMIQTLLSAIYEKDCEIASGMSTRSIEELGDGTDTVNFFNNEKALIEMFYDRELLASACAKIYKKELAQAVAFEEGRIYEDYLFSIVITSMSKGVALVKKPLYFYRVNNNSITQLKFYEKEFDILHAANQVEEIIKNFNRKLLKYAYIRRCHLAINLYVKCCLADKLNEYGKKIRKEVKSHFLRFVCSRKPLKRKVLAVAIVLCPKLANNMIAKRYK